MKKLILISYLPIFVVQVIHAQQSDFPKLTRPFLGQKPPGIVAQVFAPGIVSTVKDCCQAGEQERSGLQGPNVGHLPLARVQPQTKQESEREIVARTISSVIGWAKDKNLDLFYSVICHDTDYVSVSPGKRVVKRFEDVKQSVPFWMSPDFKYVRHELKDLRIRFSRAGNVAWFYCVLDDINTFTGEPASWENARWTGVVEKRDGRWVVVQQHFSFPSEK